MGFQIFEIKIRKLILNTITSINSNFRPKNQIFDSLRGIKKKEILTQNSDIFLMKNIYLSLSHDRKAELV